MAASSSPPSVLSATTTFPIHICGLEPDARTELLSLLSHGQLRDNFPRISALVSTAGFTWLELDAYVAQCRPLYLSALAVRRRSADNSLPDNGCSFSDRARTSAVRKIAIRPYCDLIELADLLDGKPGSSLIPFLLHLTHFHGQAQYRMSQQSDSGVIQISAIRDTLCCPHCRSYDGKRFPRTQLPRLPHHLGCRCGTITR
jgi:hypothetical protein